MLVPHQDEGGTPRSAQDSDVDEMSVPGADLDNGFVVSGVEEPPRVQEVLDLEDIQANRVRFRAVLRSMDNVDLNRFFQRGANVMKSVPQVVKGPFRNAMKIVLEEIVTGHECGDASGQERAWKAFLSLPRLLLHRKCKGGKIGKKQLRERFEAFRMGHWGHLLAISVEWDEEASRAATRKKRNQHHRDWKHQENGAMTRIQMGELTAARQKLEGAELVASMEATLHQLRQRPTVPLDSIPPEILHHEPARAFFLDEDKFRANLRSSRRGTAGGPSGMTIEHLRPLLDSKRDMSLFHRVDELLNCLVVEVFLRRWPTC